MVRDGHKDLLLTMHKVSDVIDDGELVARSQRRGNSTGINTTVFMNFVLHPGMKMVLWSVTPPTSTDCGCSRLERIFTGATLLAGGLISGFRMVGTRHVRAPLPLN